LPRLIAYLMVHHIDFRQSTVHNILNGRGLLVTDIQVQQALEQLVLYSILDSASLDDKGNPNDYVFASNLLTALLKSDLAHDPKGLKIRSLEEKVASEFGRTSR
jgi:hypothetical protein